MEEEEAAAAAAEEEEEEEAAAAAAAEEAAAEEEEAAAAAAVAEEAARQSSGNSQVALRLSMYGVLGLKRLYNLGNEYGSCFILLMVLLLPSQFELYSVYTAPHLHSKLGKQLSVPPDPLYESRLY